MTKLLWSEDEKRLENEPSLAEKRIIKILNKKKIKYFREVKFEGLTSKKGFSLYFDFYIPSKNLIIEYDGPHHLTDETTIEHDKIKNDYCKINKIKIRRFNNKEWMLLEKIIKSLIGDNYDIVEEKNKGKKNKPVKTKERIEQEKIIKTERLKNKFECKQYKRMRGEISSVKVITEKVRVPNKFMDRVTYKVM